MEKRISLIVPVHRPGKLLYESLKSYSSALNKFDELLIIFDNTDSLSVQAYESFIFESKPVCSVHVEHVNLGSVALSRNLGLKISNGEWIAYADHDDKIDSNIYENLLHCALSSNAEVIRSGYTLVKQASEFVDYELNFEPFYCALFGIFVWSSLYRKELLRKHQILFKPGYGEDYEFNFALASIFPRFSYCQGSYYKWHHHSNNLHKKRRLEDFLERAKSIAIAYADIIKVVPNANAAYISWVAKNINHISTQHSLGEDYSLKTDLDLSPVTNLLKYSLDSAISRPDIFSECKSAVKLISAYSD